MTTYLLTTHLLNLWLAPFLLTTFHTSWQYDTVAFQEPHAECIEQAVGNHEIVTSQSLDVDQEGSLEELIFYKNDYLYVLIVDSPSSADCSVILNDPFTAIALVEGQKTVEVKKIEMVELTGDSRPELYIWVDTKGGGRAVSAAVHTIYAFSDGIWQQALHIEQCLGFSSFQFRNTEMENIKEIYRTTDIQCETPFSTNRNYNVFRWDGNQFALIESGEITGWSFYPPIWYLLCGIAVIGLIATAGILIRRFK